MKKYDKKNLQLQGLMLIYDKLNNRDASDARKLVYETYHQRLIEQGLKNEFTPDTFSSHPVIDIAKDDGRIRNAVERVRSDFEQIAVMEHNGLLNERAYFDAYWGTALRVYGAIHGHIETIRKESGTKHYSVYFERQSERMLEYWKEYHPDSKIIYYGGNHSFYD